MTVVIVIPAYGEAPTIADIVQRARQQLEPVVVVDDGSADDTASRAQRAGATVLRQPNNQGKGMALWRGLHYATTLGAEAVISLDGDGQHRPEDIPKLLDAHRRWPDRLVIAARLERRDRAPRMRRCANAIADFWLSWAAGWPIRDSQSGFRLYPASLLQRMSGPRPGQGGFAFESQALLQAARLGCHPVTVAIETLYPPQNRPSHYRPWRDTLRITALVAGELFGHGLYPTGLLRALRRPPPAEPAHRSDTQQRDKNSPAE